MRKFYVTALCALAAFFSPGTRSMSNSQQLQQTQQMRLQQRINPRQVALGRVLEMSVPEFDEEIRLMLLVPGIRNAKLGFYRHGGGLKSVKVWRVESGRWCGISSIIHRSPHWCVSLRYRKGPSANRGHPCSRLCRSSSTVQRHNNREPSMPKSWFDEGSPMKSDAFHIYPTDGKVNNQRSNYPFSGWSIKGLRLCWRA